MIKLYIFESVSDALAFEHADHETAATLNVVKSLAAGKWGPTTEEIIGDQTPPRKYKRKTTAVNKAKEAFKKRILGKAKSGKCGYCHSSEHRGKDCPSKPGGFRKGPRTVTCKNCGKTGHIAKTCPEKKPIQPDLTQEQMDFIKELAEQGKSIAEIVMETGLPSKVVKENMY